MTALGFPAISSYNNEVIEESDDSEDSLVKRTFSSSFDGFMFQMMHRPFPTLETLGSDYYERDHAKKAKLNLEKDFLDAVFKAIWKVLTEEKEYIY